MRAWEDGQRSRLWLGWITDGLTWQLGELVLPSICTLIMGGGAQSTLSFYVSTPKDNWREELIGKRDFIRTFRGWSRFVEFSDRWPYYDYLYFEYPGLASSMFNVRYKDRVLFVFDETELDELAKALKCVCESWERARSAVLTPSQAQLLERARKDR